MSSLGIGNRFFLGVAIVASLMGEVPVQAAEDRISRPLDTSQMVLVKGSLHPGASPESDRGPVATSLPVTGITINIKLSGQQQSELDQLLEEQRDPSSPAYRKWLTPEEYGARFGLSQGDMDKLTSWLRSEGFSVEHVARSMNWVSFSGTASQVDRSFHTGLHMFLVDGETHFANTREPSVPAALADVIAGFRGLTDFRLKPPKLKTRTLSPDYTTSGGSHLLAPGDLATIYNISPLYNSGIDGTGQKLVVAGQTDVAVSDIQAFRSQFGLPANTPQMMLFGKDPGTVSGDMQEADLDLEWTGSVARNATIIYVYSTDVITSVQYAISQSLAPVISLSYGGCEAENSSSLRTLAQQANAQGITWLASSGDSGAAGCDSGKIAKNGLAVNMPASIPEVTGVGGSEFSEVAGTTYWNSTNGANGGSAISYIPEMAWNDSIARGDLAATGGGASIYYSKPAWQVGPGVPPDGARDVPDVSLPASPDHDGYYFYTGGSLMVVGGTSVSTPAFAGIVTLLNHHLVTNGVLAKPGGLGNVNPTLYHLAAGPNSIFHDITAGNNSVPCAAGSPNCTNGTLVGFSAGPGYDQATGLGSVDANNLVTLWTSIPASVSTTLTLNANPATIASTASTTITATVKALTGTTVPSGNVTFTEGTKTLGTAVLAASGNGATATLSVSAASLASGNNTITATYSGSSTLNGSTGTTVVTVTGSALTTTTTLTANPASIATTASTVLTATVKAASGTKAPAGTATFSLAGTTLGSANLVASGTSGIASFTLSGSKLLIGTNTITVVYAGSASFTGSSAMTNVTVTAPTGSVVTTVSVSANPVTVSATGSTVITATVRPASGTVAPTGTVTFTSGNSTLGTGSLTASGASAVATLTVHGNQLASGLNTIKASYSGSTAFSASSGTVGVTLTGNTSSSNVTVTVNPDPVVQKRRGWIFTIQLTNTGGVTTLTDFTVNGTSYASQIVPFFGSASIPANGKLTSNLEMTNVPVPTSIVFGFSGVDASGNTWTQTATVPFP